MFFSHASSDRKIRKYSFHLGYNFPSSRESRYPFTGLQKLKNSGLAPTSIILMKMELDIYDNRTTRVKCYLGPNLSIPVVVPEH